MASLPALSSLKKKEDDVKSSNSDMASMLTLAANDAIKAMEMSGVTKRLKQRKLLKGPPRPKTPPPKPKALPPPPQPMKPLRSEFPPDTPFEPDSSDEGGDDSDEDDEDEAFSEEVLDALQGTDNIIKKIAKIAALMASDQVISKPEMAKILDVMLAQIPDLWNRIKACEEELERQASKSMNGKSDMSGMSGVVGDDDKKKKKTTKANTGIPIAITAMISLLSVMMAFLTMSSQAMITSVPGEPPKGGDGGVYTLLIAPPDKPDSPVVVPALPPPDGLATPPQIVRPRGVRKRIDKRPKLPRNPTPTVEDEVEEVEEVEEEVVAVEEKKVEEEDEIEEVVEYIPTNPEWWQGYLEKALVTLGVGVLAAGAMKEGSKY